MGHRIPQQLLAKGSALVHALLGTGAQNYVVAVIDDPREAVLAVGNLRRVGFRPEDVTLLDPQEVEARVRAEQQIHLDLLEEVSFCVDFDELALGSSMVWAYARAPEDVELAHSVFAAHNGREIWHFGAWTVTELPYSQPN